MVQSRQSLFHSGEVLRPMAQLYFYYSAMNAGKSTALLQSSYNYQERGMRTVVYTAEIDDRFGAGKVSSRIGLSSPAKLFNQNTSLFEEIRAESARQTIHCVLVDESQFLTRQQVYQLSEVVDKLDIPVLCYGLRTDFRGELFVGSQYLLAWSDKLVELKTICFCGRKASMVLRLDQDGRPYNEGEQVVIGGNERYVSVCRKHYKDALEEGSLTAIQERHRHI
ncbi:thymidine kinase [Salmonella enterica subsp. enterica serovar Kentucky str. CVM29188]|nr:thymidine kinase [Salmonella enterica subsp. enterica serovar Typhimurium str. ST4/74]AIE05632.1 Thymidine kinase [Salmonella enterica subsp. enterica serovar Typhimurium]EDX43781.1 thymidine kinase [Salmonella enterica subsp. enterica serovar Kentucky str. CVM29188]EDZ08449.1 thymidine kinase [Salmonella enterica subsp. enterica serovar Javiana str. GA_MM04042433]EDZ22032.1 thymidine kinase [Salmonella enterica subsp. enterica serovar Kentucky str. CDC 191]